MSTTDTTVHTDTTNEADERSRAVVRVPDDLWRRFKAEAEMEDRNPSNLAEDAFRLYLKTKGEPVGTFPSAGGPE